ncbi:MAG: hypothetical protein H6641_17970 [Caldilineaceae bacterium]|nr:hypothetical protein [Caldilineaceae bacterium]
MKTRKNMALYVQRILNTIIVLSVLLSGTSFGAKAAPASAPAALDDASDFLFNDDFNGWTIGGGFIYLAENCYAAGETNYSLKRRPLAGGAAVTIESGTGKCNRYQGMAADDSGVYYYNPSGGLLEYVPVTAPNGPPVSLVLDGVAPVTTDLVLDSERIYWSNGQSEIYSVSKSGGVPLLLMTAIGAVRDIEVDGNDIYWIDDEGVWWADKNCTPTSCTGEQLFAVQHGNSFVLARTQPFNNMHRTIYLWHGATIGTRQLMRLPAAAPGQTQAELLYEVPRIRFPGGVVAAGINSAQESHLYWTESGYPGESPIRRLEIGGGSPDDIHVENNIVLGDQLYADDEYLYFSRLLQTGLRQMRRIPLDAAAIERDIQFTNWEVTQAIQNLDNENPLVADKPTLVRVYGTITGGDANMVYARLEGRRNGVALPGSPLPTINGPRNLQVIGNAINRDVDNKSWNFELPAAWTSAGDIELTVRLDPYHTYTDPDLANNDHAETFTFTALNDVCIYSWPIHSHAPIPSAQDPNVSETFDLFERLWPIDQAYHLPSSEPIEELETCWGWGFIPYPCWGPYEMGQQRDWTNWITDREWVILKLMEKQLWTVTIGRDTCDSSDSRHALGLVHADSDPRTPAGFGNMSVNTAFVKMPAPDDTISVGTPWAWPRQGQSMAHELAHNVGRGHIDCGDPENNVDTNFPYGMPNDQCVLDDREETASTTYFGYDLATYTPIKPASASDFLGYDEGVRWVSDYTFKGLFNALGTATNTNLVLQAAGPSPSAAANSVFVSGLIEPNRGLGQLEYAYVQPNSTFNAAALQNIQQATAMAAQSSAVHHIRFMDAQGQILGDHKIALSATSDHDDYAVHTFAALLPAPTGTVSSIELMADNRVLFTRNPGPAQPAVTILTPTGGVKVNDALEVRWTGADADSDDILLYNIDYSPDNGQSWIQLVAGYPGTPDTDEVSYTLHDPTALPGANGASALIRILASDGYNTTTAVSQPFEVTQRAPAAHILHPQAEQWVEAGAVAPLRGSGYDAEDGALTGDALRWTVDGNDMGAGTRQLAAGFAPGAYPVMLQAVDSTNQTATDQSTLNVAALAIPQNDDSVVVDGRCTDEVYQGGKNIPLAPYADGSQASVQLVRMKNEMAVCFSNLMRAVDGPPTQAGLFFDINHSRDGAAQSDDVGFLLGEDGTPAIVVGDGNGNFVAYADNNFGHPWTQVSATAERWQAEFRISLNGWNPVVGLLASHLNVNNSGVDARWPYRAGGAAPKTWGTTVIADFPRIEAVTPLSASVGAPATTVEISGQQLAPNSNVTWDGQILATTFVSDTLLKATVDANKLLVAGNHTIALATPGLEEAPAPGLIFSVSYPAPQITGSTPSSVIMEGPAFDLTVLGTGFADGATILWNGEAQPTVRVSATELRAAIPASALLLGREIGIHVSNPTPNLGGSNTVMLPIQTQGGALLPIPGQQQLYLPLTFK